MSLKVQRAVFFTADFEKQFAWYVDRAGAELGWRFQAALGLSLLLSRIRQQGNVVAPIEVHPPEDSFSGVNHSVAAKSGEGVLSTIVRRDQRPNGVIRQIPQKNSPP